MNTITTFGEIMLRISPADNGERLTQATQFRVDPGGSESNVAIALSNLGQATRYVTKLPNSALSKKVIQSLKQYDIDTSFILMGGDKIGIYWTENGLGPRNSFVIYDRSHSSFCDMKVEDFDWEVIFRDSSWFHFSGISPALSENVNDSLIRAVSRAKIPYSVDLNFRTKLWDWVSKDPSHINEHMGRLCENATLIAGNESDFQDVFGIQTDSSTHEEVFDEIARKCFDRFHNLKYISISNRVSISASSNIWNGFLFVNGMGNSRFIGIKYELESIVDRVGTGDSFVAGIIFGLINKDKYSYQQVVDFATTLAALNHTTLGDASRFTCEEVWSVIGSKGSGRIQR
jgi:2-dehydro-3-deoxygluconokinase